MSGRNVNLSFGVYVPQKPKELGKGVTKYQYPQYSLVKTSMKLRTKAHYFTNGDSDEDIEIEAAKMSEELRFEILYMLEKDPDYLKSIAVNLLKKIRTESNK